MNGIHDMGGMMGFGAVEREADEAPFHAHWEGRVYGMQRSMGEVGLWNIDLERFSLETLPPLRYLAASYYERWLLGLESRLLGYGLLSAEEIAAGRSLAPPRALPKTLKAGDVERILNRATFARSAAAPARFAAGERVRAKNLNPPTHTRLPRYARGHWGVIESLLGCHVFPDSLTTGGGEDPQWLYMVVFTGKELWGENADPSLKVAIEAFEPYLEAA